MTKNEELQIMKDAYSDFAHEITKQMAEEVLSEDISGRDIARIYGVARSTFYWRIDHWLSKDDPDLYKKIKDRLDWNRAHNRK